MRSRRPAAVCIVRQGANDALLQREWRALRNDGIAVDVILERESGRPWRETTEGVCFYRLPVTRRRDSALHYAIDYARFFVLASVLLTVLHARRRYRAVQVTTMPDFLVFAALPAKLLGARLIGFFKEPTPELAAVLTTSGRLARALVSVEQAAIRLCDDVLTVTEQLKGTYVSRGADPSKISVVLNATEPPDVVEQAEPAPRDEFVIFTHGTIEHRYGHETVLRAVRSMREYVPNVRFVFCGRGNHLEQVLELVQELDLEPNVTYLGFISPNELAEALQRADVGIVAQLSSPYSHLVHTVKMFEYLDAGLPVVLSRLDASFAHFGTEECLTFFDPGDPASLCEKLLELHRDRAALRWRASRAREIAREYGWSAQRQQYLALYAPYAKVS